MPLRCRCTCKKGRTLRHVPSQYHLRIRARIRILHAAAQLKQDLIQGVRRLGPDHGGQLLVGLGAQGGTGGGVGLAALGIVIGVDDAVGFVVLWYGYVEYRSGYQGIQPYLFPVARACHGYLYVYDFAFFTYAYGGAALFRWFVCSRDDCSGTYS